MKSYDRLTNVTKQLQKVMKVTIDLQKLRNSYQTIMKSYDILTKVTKQLQNVTIGLRYRSPAT